jgi:hypothetical protein
VSVILFTAFYPDFFFLIAFNTVVEILKLGEINYILGVAMIADS